MRRTRKSASGYLGQSEPQLTFGLLPGETPLEVEVLWPSGLREVFVEILPGKELLLIEGGGRTES